jgi:thiamine-phosphate pyrophosphorylase
MQRAVLRILDANLDRSREGLRVIEEWCRFGLEDPGLSNICKHLRQELAGWHSAAMRQARDTPADPGTALTHPQESQRQDINHLLLANFARVQEGLRVLEEYAKLLDESAMAGAMKQMRYQVYAIESQMLGSRRLEHPLYLVTSPQPNLLEVVEKALQGGLRLVQYRDKTADNSVRLENARQLQRLCHQYQATFIVNDHIDVALAVDADGVHLGQQDFPMDVARRLMGPGKIIGRSTTNIAELEGAIAEGADYIGVGPVYETPTKPGKTAAGDAYLAYAKAHAPMPWYAIGGVDADNLAAVMAMGADRVAVVRAIMAAPDPTSVTQTLITQLAAV